MSQIWRIGRGALWTWGPLVAALTLLPSVAHAQRGDRPGEEQPDLPESLEVPEAPVLTPEQALASFTVQDGFRVEIVAAEPLIEDPVAIEFDASGRLWVVEMRGFMPNIDGTDEDAPVGRIVILEDDDGDGRMDRSTVFLDELVLPRAIGLAHGGALIVAPPELIFCKDTDGDGKADTRKVLYTGFGGIESPEHAGNGLLYGLDNWYHCSQHRDEFLFNGDDVTTRPTPGYGQWGLTQDDVGRLYHTPNSHPLRGDRFPKHYGSRHPHLRSVVGLDVPVSNDYATWPARITPGVNRGYQKQTLRDDFTLAKVTAACGPVIYRGDMFPDSFRGNAFISEPSANLIKRNVMLEEDDGAVARAAYEQRDFLASTDERFRPVNLSNGPDGALYVVDMYRGILQHKIFMTSFLRKQIEERGLDRPIGLGRIYRIVPEDGSSRDAGVNLADASSSSLVDMLEHRNGWKRDTAQRLLVERKATEVTLDLVKLASFGSEVAPRLHAMWTLDGIGTLTAETVIAAMNDESPFVRAAGVRLGERFPDDERIVERYASLIDDPSLHVRRQVALSLGEMESESSIRAMVALITQYAEQKDMRSVVFSGLHQREIPFMSRLLAHPEWTTFSKGRATVIASLSSFVLKSQRADDITGLIELAVTRPAAQSWQSRVMLESVATAARMDTDQPRLIELSGEPAGWRPSVASAESSSLDEETWALACDVDPYLKWPNREETSVVTTRPLTSDEQTLFNEGQLIYFSTCMSCHQSNGQGQGNTNPPLAGSDWVLGSPETLIKIMLNGLEGPIEVNGEKFNSPMPGAPMANDREIAALLTYIRRSWGNEARPVEPEDVRRVRRQHRRRGPWTAEDLGR